MVTVPYLASCRWYSVWLGRLLCGDGFDRAAAAANTTCGTTSRSLSRALIEGADGRVVMLSVPVRGGASALKRVSPELLTISGHGHWQHVHTGAISAAFGRTPYYQHLMPWLEQAYRDCGSEGDSLHGLNDALHLSLMRLLRIDETLPALRQMWSQKPELLRDAAAQTAADYDVDLSALSVAMKHGPDAIFTLLTPLVL